VHSGLDVLTHEQSGNLEQKLLGGDLAVECEFAAVGEVLEQIEAVVEYSLVLDAESLGDAVEGVLGPAWGGGYMSTLEFIMSRMRS
jgi:hypothetical protein